MKNTIKNLNNNINKEENNMNKTTKSLDNTSFEEYTMLCIEYSKKLKEREAKERYNLYYKEEKEVIEKLNYLFNKYEGRTLTRAQFKELLTESLNNNFRVCIDCGIAGVEVFDDIIYEFSELGQEFTYSTTKEEQLKALMEYFGCQCMEIYGVDFKYEKRRRRVRRKIENEIEIEWWNI